MKRFLLLILAIGHTLTSFSQNTARKYALLITNANIVDVTSGTIKPHSMLAIANDTIQVIDHTNQAKNYKADRYVDLKDKYLIPGLWDMHVHFRGGDSLREQNKAFFPLFLAHGVTTVRDCGGDITPAVMRWRKQTKTGLLPGPRIYTSGPKLDGFQSSWPGSLEVETPDQIGKALDSLQKLQVDFVKLYDSKISRQAFLEVISQAKKRGLKTSGHMPFTVTLTEAVGRGFSASEHMFYVFKGCSAKEDSITQLIQQSQHTDKPLSLFSALPLLYATFDEKKAAQLFRYLAQQQVRVIPTLFVSRTMAELKQMQHSRDSLRAYIDPKIEATYRSRINSALRQSEEATQFLKRFDQKCQSLIPQLHAAGVQLMAGSDCGAFNSYVYPGSSLHEELKLLVAAGLTPAQVLKIATLNGASFMGVDHFYGSIQAGKSADLVLLSSNPLVNIHAIDQIQGVHAQGRFFTSKELKAGLQTVKRKP